MSEGSSELLGIARFAIHPGMVEEFTRLSAECMDIVRAQDPGTLQYEVYLDDDGTRAMVLERYRDSAALIEHSAHVAHLMAAIMATGSVSGELLGSPSAELRATLARAPVELFRLHQAM